MSQEEKKENEVKKSDAKPKKKGLGMTSWILIALVAGIDRIFDMGRTTVNITGDASAAVVVNNLENRKEARKAA